MIKELEYIQSKKEIVEQQVKGSNMKIIVTDTVTKHQYDYYENELQTLESIEQALLELQSIKETNPSEALECLEALEQDIKDRTILAEDRQLKLCAVIKQALLKAQEPKHYLKWEDLEFNIEKQMMAVLLNGTKYTLILGRNVHIDKLAFLRNGEINYYFLEIDKQLFNDLHLERVEE